MYICICQDRRGEKRRIAKLACENKRERSKHTNANVVKISSVSSRSKKEKEKRRRKSVWLMVVQAGIEKGEEGEKRAFSLVFRF